jgi:type II secretory pathway pseudopilin PulG
MRHLTRKCHRGRNRGFTFLGLMIVVAVMGVGLLAVGEVWHAANIREKEEELLFVGDQYQQAIKAYYVHSPNKLQPYPMNLEDLLKDPRYPTTQRYLRKIYNDPIQGNSEWGLMKSANGGIIGVHSLSEEMPVKQGNFRLKYQELEGKEKYSEWVFMYVPPIKSSPRH